MLWLSLLTQFSQAFLGGEVGVGGGGGAVTGKVWNSKLGRGGILGQLERFQHGTWM